VVCCGAGCEARVVVGPPSNAKEGSAGAPEDGAMELKKPLSTPNDMLAKLERGKLAGNSNLGRFSVLS